MTTALALTLGEPAGIGPDITLQAWLRRTELGLPAFYVRGDPAIIAHRAKLLDLPVAIAEVRPEQAAQAFASALPVISTGHAVIALPGRPYPTSAEAAIGSIPQAGAGGKARAPS